MVSVNETIVKQNKSVILLLHHSLLPVDLSFLNLLGILLANLHKSPHLNFLPSLYYSP